MKKIFGKNQVIISALAIMIAIAGYLSITQDKTEEAVNLVGDSGTSNGELIYDISEDDLGDNAGYEYTDSGDVVLATEEPSDNNEAEPTPSDAQAESTAQPDGTTQTAASDNAGSEMQTSENVGEAVLVSSTIGSEYFDSAKLSREQTRSKNKEILMEIINSSVATDTQKEDAVNEVIGLTSDSEKENAAETMLGAKGFGECIVSIEDGKVDVIVNANNLTEKDIAQIEDIVKRKTDAAASDIVITPVGVTGQ